MIDPSGFVLSASELYAYSALLPIPGLTMTGETGKNVMALHPVHLSIRNAWTLHCAHIYIDLQKFGHSFGAATID